MGDVRGHDQRAAHATSQTQRYCELASYRVQCPVHRRIVGLVQLDDRATAVDGRAGGSDARADGGTEQRDRMTVDVRHAQALLLGLVQPDRGGIRVQRARDDLHQPLQHAIGLSSARAIPRPHERRLRRSEVTPGAAQAGHAERERSGVHDAVGEQFLVERQRACGRIGDRAEGEAVEDEHLLRARPVVFGSGRGRVPALRLLTQAHADTLDRQPAAQLGGKGRSHGSAVVQRGELARHAAHDRVEPAGRGGAGTRRDACERAATDGREAVEQLARLLVGDLGADRRQRRPGIALERHDDGRHAFGAMLGEGRLDARAIAPFDREQEHGAGREQRTRLVDDQRENLVATRGRGARRRHAARTIQRPAGREAARRGALERACHGHGEGGCDARRHGPHEHDRNQQRGMQ